MALRPFCKICTEWSWKNKFKGIGCIRVTSFGPFRDRGWFVHSDGWSIAYAVVCCVFRNLWFVWSVIYRWFSVFAVLWEPVNVFIILWLVVVFSSLWLRWLMLISVSWLAWLSSVLWLADWLINLYGSMIRCLQLSVIWWIQFSKDGWCAQYSVRVPQGLKTSQIHYTPLYSSYSWDQIFFHRIWKRWVNSINTMFEHMSMMPCKMSLLTPQFQLDLSITGYVSPIFSPPRIQDIPFLGCTVLLTLLYYFFLSFYLTITDTRRGLAWCLADFKLFMSEIFRKSIYLFHIT